MRRSSLRALTFRTALALRVTTGGTGGRGGTWAIANHVHHCDDLFSSTGRAFLGRCATCRAVGFGLAARRRSTLSIRIGLGYRDNGGVLRATSLFATRLT